MGQDKHSNTTQVSIIIPCRNEAGYIESFLSSLFTQDLHGIKMEVLIADGMSDDGTREILDRYRKKHPEIRVIDNPERIVSTGLNAAIKEASGDIIIRMDVHSEYNPDYIRQCVAALKQSGAHNVGGPWRAAGKTYLQEAIALAFQSPFSSGGANSHSIDKEGVVDSVYLGCWRKDMLEKIGMFDEELVRNQDDELNLRLTRSGYRVWQSPKIKSWYYPRASIKALFKQYMQYGYWKVRVIQKHRLPASPRHLVPGGFVFSLIALMALSPFYGPALWFLIGLASLYAFANILATIVTCRKPGLSKFIPVMPFVFAAYHFGYGYGFLRGVVDFVILRKGGSTRFTKITRGEAYE